MSNTPVITVAELATMIANGDKIVVGDCRFDPFAPEAGLAAYAQGHIRGAHYLHLDNDLAGAVGKTGGRHPVPSPEDFTALMRGIGVDNDSLLVAYDGGGLATASRLWWLARYFGHANVAVLNGGMAARTGSKCGRSGSRRGRKKSSQWTGITTDGSTAANSSS